MNAQAIAIMPAISLIEQADSLLKEAEHLQKQGYFIKALQHFEKASRIFEENQQWERYFNTELQLIELQLEALVFEGLKEKIEELLQYSLSHFGEQHLTTATCYRYLGHFYRYAEYWTDERKIARQKCLFYYEKHSEILQKLHGGNHPNLFQHFCDLGDYWMLIGDYAKSLDCFNKMLAFLDKHSAVEDLGLYYRKIGICYFYQARYDKTLDWSLRALDISLQYYPTFHPKIALIYQALSVAYQAKGDIDKALLYAEQALNINTQTLDTDNFQTYYCYNLIARAYLNKHDFSNAIHYLEKFVDNLQAHHPTLKEYLAYAYLNLGYGYFDQQKISEAKPYFERALAFFQQFDNQNNRAKVYCLTDLGRCHLVKDEFEEGLSYLQQALKCSFQISGEKHTCIAGTYTFIGIYYIQVQDLNTALQHFQKAICSLTSDWENEDIYSLPPFEKTGHYISLLEALKYKAQTLYQRHKTHFSIKDLKAAAAAYTLADQTIDAMRSSYHYETSQLILVSRAQTIYASAIEVNLCLYEQTQDNQYLNACFRYAEKSKAIVLLSQLKDAEAKINAQIPADLLQKEYDLRTELKYLDKQILAHENESKNGQLSALQNQRFHFLQEYEGLIADFEANYPQYHELKYNIEVTSIPTVQAQLQEDEAIVEYFVGEKYLFTFFITSTDFQAFQREKPSDFEQMLEDFHEAIHIMLKSDYLELAYELYQLLLGQLPPTDFSNNVPSSSISKLLIVPDDVLTQLPFEALLTSEVNPLNPYSDLPYLLMQFDVCYHYSATLWQRGKHQVYFEDELKLTESFVGFAPVYRDAETQKEQIEEKELAFAEDATRSITIRGKDYKELIYSEKEVNEIQYLFDKKAHKTQIFLHEKASISNFKKSLKDFKYLHIAAHGYFNAEHPEHSGILFSPSKEGLQEQESETETETIFSLGDAYHLQLDADLVVLSCCESGIGKLAKGEGMIAMNRGFLSAGAANVIYTLFKVYDKASCELTQSLFHHILEGKTYAQALKAAKLQLIQSGKATPRLWAGYVLIGV